MKKKELEATAKKHLLEILEQHLFLLLDPLCEDLPLEMPVPYIEARLTFSGIEKGSFSLALPFSACSEALSNVSPDLDPSTAKVEDLHDLVAEALNVIGPNVLAEWLAPDGIFEIGLPVVQAMKQKDWEGYIATRPRIGFSAEGHPVFFGIHFEGPSGS